MLKSTYSHAANAYMLYLAPIGPGEIALTHWVDRDDVPADIMLHFDKQRRLIGVEVQGASTALPREVIDSAEQIDVD